METTYKQELIDKFLAEVLLMPEEYLAYFLGLMVSFRQQLERMETQKQFESGVREALHEVKQIEQNQKPYQTLTDLIDKL